jgi:hypothetical protein
MSSSRHEDIESLREENRRLRDEISEAKPAAEELAKAQAELKDIRVEQQMTRAREEDLEALREENVSLKDEIAELKELQQVAEELETAQAEIKDLRIKQQMSQAREQDFESLREENQKLRDELADLAELRAASEELKQLREEHQQLRLKTDVAARKAEEAELAGEERASLQAKVEDLSREVADSKQLRLRIQELEAQIFSAGIQPKEPKKQKPAPTGTVKLDKISEALSGLGGSSGVRAAVVADAQGLLVAGAGEAGHHEGMAAIAGLIGHLAMTASDLLPLSGEHTVYIEDPNKVSLSYRIFQSGTDTFALGTLGTKKPPEAKTLEKYLSALSDALG